MAKRENEDLRRYAKSKGVELWRLSERIGYSHEGRLSRELRHPLPRQRLIEYKNLIDELSLKVGNR